jgi:hypothetical protein
MFGGRKFDKWVNENPSTIANIINEARGQADRVEDLLNSATGGEYKKQVHGWIKKCKKRKILLK